MIQRWELQILCAIALSASAVVHAEDSIATDRPDVVESSEVVGKGRFQIETSFAAEREAKNSPRTRTYSTPTLLRIGVSENVELRMETDGLMRMSTWDADEKTTKEGINDIAFGLKWHVNSPPRERKRPEHGLAVPF